MASEYLEARVVIPERKVEEFLAFCERVLGTMPAVNRITDMPEDHEVIRELEAADRKAKATAATTE